MCFLLVQGDEFMYKYIAAMACTVMVSPYSLERNIMCSRTDITVPTSCISYCPCLRSPAVEPRGGTGKTMAIYVFML